MGAQHRFSPGRSYLMAVPAVGIAVIGLSAHTLYQSPPSPYWLLVSGLTALTGAFTAKIPGLVVRLSLSEPLVFLSTLLFGPAAGTLTAALDALVMSLRLVPRLRTPHRILFNVGGIAICLWPSAHLYFWLAGLEPLAPRHGSIDTFVIPLYVFAGCLFLSNSWLVAIALSIERGVSAFSIWVRQFVWLSASYFASAAIAAILVVLATQLDIGLVGLLLPLAAVSYFVVRVSLGRLEDTQRHLTEVNRLYLSTIETLAMAIDAKDQVTHGHIRRVQLLATQLAKAVGVVDERQLRAIEAAALLHDMGKLAIPEFILNKPGRLTQREFAVMQTHAAIGADILSAIQFPYPVVPMVRHHHENWDGTGYPDGLRGADIPLGARILSVVDCYDALTSDRPYRAALTSEQAVEILAQRRGSMYDPLVVDAFIRNHVALSRAAELGDMPAAIIAKHHYDLRPDTVAQPAAQTAPTQSLRLLAGLGTADGLSLTVVCAQAVRALRDIATFDTAVIYLLNDHTSDAEVVFADGSAAAAFAGRRIAFAERLSGWVAAHRTAVWNSDASLDLEHQAGETSLSLGSSLPLSSISESTFGVLSLYGRKGEEITVDQRRALESLLPAISASLGDASRRPGLMIDCADGRLRTAAVAALDALLAHERRRTPGPSAGLLFITVTSPSDPASSGRTASAAAELWRLLSPHSSDSRCVLKLGETEAILCPLDGTEESLLVAEVAVARDNRNLRGATVDASPLRSSLELHDLLARLEAKRRDVVTASRLDRIH